MKILTTLLLILFCFTCTAQKLTDSLALVKAPFETQIIQPGVKYQHFHFQDSAFFNAKENINMIRVAKNAMDVRWVLGTDYDSLIKTSTLAKRYKALVAINGSFFDVKKGGAVDFIKINNQVLDTSRNNGHKLAEHQQSALVFQNNMPQIIHARDSLDFDWQKSFASFTDVMVTGPWSS